MHLKATQRWAWFLAGETLPSGHRLLAVPCSQRPDILATIQSASNSGALVDSGPETDTSETCVESQSIGLSLRSIGRMISGFGELNTSQFREPVTDTESMAQQCRVTFRPLPKGYKDAKILGLREQLQVELEAFGVQVLSWEDATVDFYQTGTIPFLRKSISYKTRGVVGSVNAVFDVTRPKGIWTWLGILLTELMYLLECLVRRKPADSLPALARLSLWSEDLAVRNLMDHRRTQVLTLSDVDSRLVEPDQPYTERVRLGLAALAESLAHMVLGVSGEKISMINLNMADSVFEQSEIRRFTRHVLIPKLFVPIVPLLQSYFEVEHHDPQDHPSVEEVAEMGRRLAPTGLLPGGYRIRSILWRKSRSDLVRMYADGRTGVSFGFIARVEQPIYVGPEEISEVDWLNLPASKVYPSDEVRRSEQGRNYVKVDSIDGTVYRQIPDLWIASSRSGSVKTNLDPNRDVMRIGYDGRFRMSLPIGTEVGELKPSFDIRVMVALGLAAALYRPKFIANGAALFHFHGYPHRNWFGDEERHLGADNPTVPCGTFEAGALNFEAMAELASTLDGTSPLVCTIEPDHGTNVIAQDWQHLVARVIEGVDRGQIELGNRHFSSLA